MGCNRAYQHRDQAGLQHFSEDVRERNGDTGYQVPDIQKSKF